jgi:hypothetical protein
MTYALASCLSRGGKFIITPRVPTVPSYRRAWEDYCRSVRLKLFFGNRPNRAFDPRYHVPNPTWMPPAAPPFVQDHLDDLWSDITAAEAAASEYWHRGKGARRSNTPVSELRALQELKARNDIIVKPADKNLGLTLIGRDWYMRECFRQLSDEATYEEILGVPVEEVVIRCRQKAMATIDAMSFKLPANERRWLVANTNKSSAIPEFYIMPKLHKTPVKGRPIVASHSWCTTPLSIWCANRLKPVVDRLPTVLRDTQDLLARLHAVDLGPDTPVTLSTADVESLYTNIPIDDAIVAVYVTIAPLFDPHDAQDFMRALELVLRNNYISFDGRIYYQKRGLAMGTPLAPPVANTFMAWLEKRMFTLHPQIKPLIYVRYLDDIFVVQVKGMVPRAHLWTALLGMHPNISLTCMHSPRSVDFLDLVIYREGCNLLHRVHQKAMNKYLYISPYSCHPKHVITGFVRTELIRYARNSSTLADYLRICRAFSQRLRERGFHPCFLRHVFETVQFGVYPVRVERPRPMVFKIEYGPGSLDHAIPRIVSRWYEGTTDGFKAIFPKPVICHILGKNLYKMLVRARVAT